MLFRVTTSLMLLNLAGVASGQTDPQRQERLVARTSELKPFTVSLVNQKTRKPITKFWYDAAYRAPGQIPAWKTDWKHVESPSGNFLVQAPPTCLLIVYVETREYLPLPDLYGRRFEIHPTDQQRHGVIELESGITAHGIVRRTDTRQPIAGAIVKPKVMFGVHGEHAPPGPEKHETTSDKNGRFELPGIDPDLGISVFHPDYGGESFALNVTRGEGTRFDVNLPPVDEATFRGTVRDAAGQPLEAVMVSIDEKSALTTRDGTFALQHVVGPAGKHVIPGLTFEKSGFITRQVAGKEAALNGLVVVMQRKVPLEGVVEGLDGRPVKTFAICAGRGGNYTDYVSWKTRERVETDGSGRFKIWLDHEGETWVCVRAEGYEDWETLVALPRRGSSLVVRLLPGTRVTGRIVSSAGPVPYIQARLAPRRHFSDGRGIGSQDEVVDWLTKTTTVAADGTLNFNHVRPDRYTLYLEGPGVTSSLMALDVPAGGLDFGQIRLAGRGKIRGRFFAPKESVRGGGVFSFGEVSYYPARRFPFKYKQKIDFLTNEEGQFTLEDVPVGLVYVGFPLMQYPITSDSKEVEVCENRTTNMTPEGPNVTRSVRVEITIGDGSIAQSQSGKGLQLKAETKPPVRPDPPPKELDKERANTLDRDTSAHEQYFQVELIPPLPATTFIRAIRSDRDPGNGSIRAARREPRRISTPRAS